MGSVPSDPQSKTECHAAPWNKTLHERTQQLHPVCPKMRPLAKSKDEAGAQLL